MTSIDEHLVDLASMFEVRVVNVSDLPEDRDGDWDHPTRTIRLRTGLHARHRRSVLAHELAHAAYGHLPTPFGLVHAKQERQADEWAALRLVGLEEYRQAEMLHDGHLGAMAVELGVMRSILVAFQRLVERYGDATYVDAGMGRGQFAFRVDSGNEL